MKKKRHKAKVKMVQLSPEQGKATVVLEVENAPQIPSEYAFVEPVEKAPVVIDEHPDHPIVKWFKSLIW